MSPSLKFVKMTKIFFFKHIKRYLPIENIISHVLVLKYNTVSNKESIFLSSKAVKV